MKKTILFFITMGLFANAIAQKVSNVQQGSIWAPANVKIDGKLNEWGNQLQAYNKNVRLWYTLANDDKNIYLVIKSDDINTNTKILAGGISLTINTAGKKRDKDAYVITFPLISGTGGRGGHGRRSFGQQNTPDTAAIVAQQKQTLATSKEISAIGFKEITDTLISIYNEYGIKAAANIDDKGNFTYELAVPLKMLHIPDSQKEIAYNVKLNGLQLKMMSISGGGSFGGGRSLSISGSGGGFGGGPGFGNRNNNSDMDDLTSPTDFWGKYTMATNIGK